MWNISNKISQGKGIKVLIPKQILQRLPIALLQIKADSASENLQQEFVKSL